MKKFSFLVPVLLFASNILAQQGSGLHILNTYPIASAGGWDYLAVGPVNDWLYVSHGSQVNILNKKTGDSVGVIENTVGVHGIAFDVKNKKGFTSNGRLNNVFVFDLKTNKVTGKIETGQNPDAILYEPFSQKIITCNGRSKNLSIIDPAQEKLIDSILVDGKPEAAVSDGNGLLFVNIEDKNEVVEVDMRTLKVKERWSLLPAEGPTGLAYDSKTKRLFAGCENLLVIIDAVSGRVVQQVPIGAGCDGVAFDPKTQHIFTSNGSGTLTVINEETADRYTVVDNVPTKRGARTIAFDVDSQRIYLPVSEFEKPTPNSTGRPKMIPGTFQVLVIGK